MSAAVPRTGTTIDKSGSVFFRYQRKIDAGVVEITPPPVVRGLIKQMV